VDGIMKTTQNGTEFGHNDVAGESSSGQSKDILPSGSITLRFPPDTNQKAEVTADRSFHRPRSTPVQDDSIGNDAPVDSNTDKNTSITGIESEFKLQNAKSNLPPWLRTQQTPTSTSDTPVAINLSGLVAEYTGSRPSDSTVGSVPHFTQNIQKTQNDQFGNSISLQNGDNANSSVGRAAFGQVLGAANSASSHTVQSVPSSTSSSSSSGSGHMSLPAMMQSQSLPTINTGSLIPITQPNSTFLQSGSGSLMSFAAQRVLFPPGNNLVNNSNLAAADTFERSSAPGTCSFYQILSLRLSLELFSPSNVLHDKYI
jgi:hypothetical protein